MKITKQKCFAFWINEIAKDSQQYWNSQFLELDVTAMSEDAQHHFGAATDMGQTDIEKDIEDWAFEYLYDNNKRVPK